jgi:AAA15 family ATPase/GTPase
MGFMASKVMEKKRSGVKKEQPYTERGMYTSINVEGFRLFDSLKLEGLSRVNLLFGPNNCGKTSLLEALYIHACGLNFTPFKILPLLARQPQLTGALDFGEKVKGLFRDTSSLPYNFSISAKIIGDPTTYTVTSGFEPSPELADLDPRTFGKAQIIERVSEDQTIDLQLIDSIQPVGQVSVQPTFIGIWETRFGNKKEKYNLTYPPSNTKNFSPFKLGAIHDILAHRKKKTEITVFSHLKRYGILHEFTEEMKNAFPEVRDIDMIPYPDATQGPVVVKTDDNHILPLYLFGDGLRRWFYLLGNMMVYQKALHLIEEIDATLHPNAQSDLSKLLVEYTRKYDNQLFITSHSIEFADNFFKALYGEDGIIAKDEEDPVRVFTLRPSEDRKEIAVWSLTGREAYESRIHYNLELR